MEDIFKKLPKMEDYDALYVPYQEFYTHRYLYDGHDNNTVVVEGYAEKQDITEFEKDILQRLVPNCRISSLEISKHHKTSYKTVQAKVKNFEKNNLIKGYRVFLDSKQYGYDAYIILIGFSNYGREMEKKIFAYARENPTITQALKLFGMWSLMLHVRAKDYQDIQKLVVELRNTYSIIGNYEIIPIFEDISINLFPG